MEHDRALVQTNCLEVIKAIQEGYSVSSNSTLLWRIQQVLQSRNHWVIRHVPRKSNQVASLIAKMSSNEKVGIQVVEDKLRELIDTFEKDKTFGAFVHFSLI
ncbi:hypothetical protein PVK06_048853 [Gossypium arboreum]|uniref:RNase H type-1 domain-containing protein n=1 Tax=Gossypium arboreum TaxID=29729 RepID=A0ABR0MJR5_GOSAR|nr:hypothetical protein PVK06_048853 [Gossypium arboreum]